MHYKYFFAKISFLCLLVFLLGGCNSNPPFLVELWEGGVPTDGGGWKGGGYEYAQVLLYSDGTCNAVSLWGSLMIHVRREQWHGSWRKDESGEIFLKLSGRKKEQRMDEAFDFPNPNYKLALKYKIAGRQLY